MISTSVGQLMLNDALPEDLRDHNRVLDKKSIKALFQQIQARYPEKYKDILQEYMKLGGDFASTKGLSVSLRHTLPGPKVKVLVAQLKAQNQVDIDDDTIDDEERSNRIIVRTSQAYKGVEDATLEDHKDSDSPFYKQVISGGRGSAAQLNQMSGAELLVADHRNKLIPVPLYSSYADGVPPAEYWGSVYGTRRGVVSAKFSTAETGFLGKQLALAAHRFVVSSEKPKEHRLPVGLQTTVDDEGNVGAVLAHDAGPYKAGTLISPRILADLKGKDISDILVHSPLTSLDEDGGIDAWSAGSRDRGEIAHIGDNIGTASAQALTEPLTSMALSEKHSAGGGKIGKKLGGFDFINRLLQGPEFFKETAPLAPEDGLVTDVTDAPQGGKFVHMGEHKLYVHPGHEVVVKPGDKLEEGADLTDGIPHPAELIKHRGIGEARKVFLGILMNAFKDSGAKAHRRNVEPIVAGLLNHVQVTDPNGAGDHVIDDVVQYNRLAANYKPRDGFETLAPSKARGMYLEEPALHYSAGTRVNKRVAEDLDKWGIQDVQAHKDAPGFQSHWERLMTVTSRDPDWQTRLGGFYIGKSLMDSVTHGATSDPRGTSYFPAIAQGADIGKDVQTKGTY